MSSTDRLRLDAGSDDLALVRTELRKLDEQRAARNAAAASGAALVPRRFVPTRLGKGTSALGTLLHANPPSPSALPGDPTALLTTGAPSVRHAVACNVAERVLVPSDPRLPVEAEPVVSAFAHRLAGRLSRWMSAGAVLGAIGFVIGTSWLSSPSQFDQRPGVKPFAERFVAVPAVGSPVRSIGPTSNTGHEPAALTAPVATGVDRLLGFAAHAAPNRGGDVSGVRGGGVVRAHPPPQTALDARPAPRPAIAPRPIPTVRPARPTPRRSAEKSANKPTRR